jgi:hypothetical protein
MAKPPIENPTSLEKVAGNLGTGLAATLLAAFSASPVVAVLPVLTNALASGRHRRRVEKAIDDISKVLSQHELKLRNLTDSQYKLVNETVLALFSTVEKEKLEYLRRVAINALDASEIKPQETAVLSRLIRDLSADEVRFLLEHGTVERVQFSKTAPGEIGPHHIDPDSPDGLVVSGLMSLGILIQAEPTWDDSGLLRYAPIVANLTQLLRAT